MALTNYRLYRWLIYLLEKETDEQRSLSLDEITRQYRWDKDKIFGMDAKTGRFRTGLPERRVKLYDENGNVQKDEKGKDKVVYEDPVIEPKTFLNWRYAIYKYFGLLIQQPVQREKIGQRYREFVRNSYYLANPELLDENNTLRETIDMLVEEEKRGWQAKSVLTTSPRGRKKKAEGVNEKEFTGFMPVQDYVEYVNATKGQQKESEMAGLVQFTMGLGEALIIDYGKSLSERKRAELNYTKDDRFVLETQMLKYINGRWYAIGNLYQYGNRDNPRVAVYDVERIRLYDGAEDLDIPHYTVDERFDINGFIPSDWKNERDRLFDPNKVMSMYIRVRGRLFEDIPFCSAQEKIQEKGVGIPTYVYRIFIKPDEDFFTQYMAYGEEVRVVNYEELDKLPIEITQEQIDFLNDLRRTQI